MPSIVRITVSMDIGLFEDVQRLATLEDRSISNMIRVLISESLKHREEGG